MEERIADQKPLHIYIDSQGLPYCYLDQEGNDNAEIFHFLQSEKAQLAEITPDMTHCRRAQLSPDLLRHFPPEKFIRHTLPSGKTYIVLDYAHDEIYFEKIENMHAAEISAIDGNINHLESLINIDIARPKTPRERIIPSPSIATTPRDMTASPSRENVNIEPYKAALFRAIENNRPDMVERLLVLPQLSDSVIQTKIRSGKNRTDNDYLDRIQRPEHYPIIRLNRVKPGGHVALIKAAGLNDEILFNQMIQIPVIKNDLQNEKSGSGIVAFLMATRNNDGTPKSEPNKNIIHHLLGIDHIRSYAETRPHDFAEHLDTYKESQKGLKSIVQNHKDKLQEIKRVVSFSGGMDAINTHEFTPIATSSSAPPSTTTSAVPEGIETRTPSGFFTEATPVDEDEEKTKHKLS